MLLARIGLTLLCCMALLSCSRRPTFQDPAQQARYQEYRAKVNAIDAQYEAALARQPVPIIQALRQAEQFEKQMVALDETPVSAPMRRAVASFVCLGKRTHRKLVDRSARSNDALTQLIGLFGVRGCGFVTANQHLATENDELVAMAALCAEVPKHAYPFQKIPEFVELAHYGLASGMFNEELDIELAITDTQKQQRSAALVPLLQRQRWQDSSAWFADVQLQAWPATASAQRVPAPDEFKDYEVSQVEMVFSDLEFIIGIDAYAQMILAIASEADSDLTRAHRQTLLLNVLGHSNNLDALKNAQSAWTELMGDTGDVPNELARARLELADLGEVDPFADLKDLDDLRRRLEIVKRSGTLALARTVFVQRTR
jgi:hypothetical protein